MGPVFSFLQAPIGIGIPVVGACGPSSCGTFQTWAESAGMTVWPVQLASFRLRLALLAATVLITPPPEWMCHNRDEASTCSNSLPVKKEDACAGSRSLSYHHFCAGVFPVNPGSQSPATVRIEYMRNVQSLRHSDICPQHSPGGPARRGQCLSDYFGCEIDKYVR